jgi:ATP-dependent DNA helicase RecG
VAGQGKTTRRRYDRDETFESGLLKMAEEVAAALAALAGGVRSEFSPGSWRRSDRVLYPAAALREGVMNALVHRDYASNGTVLVQVLPDSIQIDNPGGLPDNMSVADLRRSHLSLPRNPDIAHVCFLHGLIEKLGRGTQMILQECRSARLKDPKWSSSALQTSLTLFAPAGAAGAEPADVSERQKLILKVLGKVESAKASEVAALLGQDVTERTVRSDLLTLVERGLLVRRGQGPSTTYQAAEPAPEA